MKHQYRTVATTLFATIVSALVLTATQSQVQAQALRAAPVAQAPVVVHQLPRVVVTGRVQRDDARAVVELPRVVVTVRRADAAQTVLSQAAARVPARS